MARPPAARRRLAGWSLPLGRWFGIPVRVHWTFFVVLALLAFWVGSSRGLQAGGVWLATLLLLFLSVLLHELGHSVTAIALGHGVRSITLLPIGGVARMEDQVRDPLDELMITAAGPTVNFVIALLLAIPLGLGWAGFHMPPDVTRPHFVSNLFWLNIVLGIFNLLPAFPMDGGRLLRSVLALGLGRLTATRVASVLGQVLALGLILLGFLVNLWLALIGAFVLFAARAEGRSVEMDEKMRGLRVGRLAIRHPEVLDEGRSLDEATERARTGYQQDFPLVDEEGRLTGYLDRRRLTAGTGRSVSHASVEPVVVGPEDDVSQVYATLARRGLSAAVVVDENRRPIGLVPVEQIQKAVIQGWGRDSSPARTTRPLEPKVGAGAGSLEP